VVLTPLRDWWKSARTALPQLGWRPIPSENWHVTLAFYGELGSGEIPKLCARLGRVIDESPRFTIETRGIGVFPRQDRPRTFWVGAFGTEPPQALAGLAYRCRQAIDEKLRRDPREFPQTFKGHISLARSSGRHALDLTPLSRYPPPNVREQVEAISLYASQLTGQGSRYTLIERFWLKG